jgi:hypothetical protein
MKENVQLKKEGRPPYARNRADTTHIPYEKIIRPSEQFPSTREYDDPSRKGRITKSIDSEIEEDEETRKPIPRNAYMELENISDSNDWETFGEKDVESDTLDESELQIEDKKFLDAQEIHKQKLNDAFYTLMQKYDEYDGWQWDETDTEKALEDAGLEKKSTEGESKAEMITTQLISGDFQGMRSTIEKILPYHEQRFDKRKRSGRGHSMKNVPNKIERMNRGEIRKKGGKAA